MHNRASSHAHRQLLRSALICLSVGRMFLDTDITENVMFVCITSYEYVPLQKSFVKGDAWNGKKAGRHVQASLQVVSRLLYKDQPYHSLYCCVRTHVFVQGLHP